MPHQTLAELFVSQHTYKKIPWKVLFKKQVIFSSVPLPTEIKISVSVVVAVVTGSFTNS